MTGDLLTYGLPVVVGALTGAVAGGLVAWKLRPQSPVAHRVPTEPEPDPSIEAELDRVSVQWAEVNNQPPAVARLMAARLKALHDIASRKGWL